jgi:Protein of unknown function, DUF547
VKTRSAPGATPSRARRMIVVSGALSLLAPRRARSAGFDQSHAAWDALLRRHVTWIDGGNASRVDYRGFATDHTALLECLQQLSAVRPDEYRLCSRAEQFAFLANAYNAFTIELVLSRYPDLGSIRDLGSWPQSPWKKNFFTLLERAHSLDEIEHGLLRGPGAFDDPRVHVAVVCASIGCPALRPEALSAARLDAQLNDSLKRFLSDRSRNRYDPVTRALAVSRIFDWYRSDFEKGFQGFHRVEDVFATYAEALADDPADRQAIRERRVPVRFLEYDWRLNDVSRSSQVQ